MTERYQTQRILKSILILFLCLILFGYTAYEIKKVFFGPQIDMLEPTSGITVASSSVDVSGIVKNVQDISLDSRPISIDEHGNFNEEVFLSPGYNIILIEANDQFGSKTRKTIELIYKP